MPATSRSDEIEILKLITEQCHCVLDWRHKIMLRFGAAIAGLALIYAYYAKSTGVTPRVLTLAVGVVVGVASFLLDCVNMRFVNESYITGARAEEKLDVYPGVFRALRDSADRSVRPRKLRQTHVLHALYLIVAVACFVSAVCLVWSAVFG